MNRRAETRLETRRVGRKLYYLLIASSAHSFCDKGRSLWRILKLHVVKLRVIRRN